jgi:hypothetical protein
LVQDFAIAIGEIEAHAMAPIAGGIADGSDKANGPVGLEFAAFGDFKVARL